MADQATLIQCIQNYQQLDEAEREAIRNFLVGKDQHPNFSDQTGRVFFSLTDQMSGILVEVKGNRADFEKRLKEAGLDEEDIRHFYPFCHGAAAQFLDAILVNNMKKANVRQVCGFIINKVILYKDFERIPFEQFQKLTGFSEMEQAQRILSFITASYTAVLTRDMSPSALESRLILDFGIEQDLVKEIIKPLQEKLPDLHMAYISRQMEQVLAKLPEK